MEPKVFFDVFPKCKLKESLREQMEQTVVTRVATNRDHTILRVYIESTALIHRRVLQQVEKELKQQLFSQMRMNVLLVVRYALPQSYTVETLWNDYQDSVLCELREEDPLEYQLLDSAKIKACPNGVLSVCVEDSKLYHKVCPGVVEYLHMIFNERCGIHVDVAVSYYEAEAVDEQEKEKQFLKEIRKQESVVEKPEAKTKKDAAEGKESRRAPQARRRSNDHPDVIFGRDFEGEITPMDRVLDEMTEVIVQGKILSVDTRTYQDGEKVIAALHVTDFHDTLSVKLFTTAALWEEIAPELAKGAFVKIKGVTAIDRYDHELAITSVAGIKRSADFRQKRQDHALEKRVELHCHTKMSDMDGVTGVDDLIDRAIEWGHPALAITDHGCVQAFTEAFHHLQKIKPEHFKMIYGVEGYLVDDLKQVVQASKGQRLMEPCVVFDLETTGFSAVKNEIIEIGAVKMINGEVTDRFSEFIRPTSSIPYRIEELTGISNEMVRNARSVEEVLPEFLEFCRGCVMVAHNADFDMGFVEEKSQRIGCYQEFTSVDTVALARILLPDLRGYKLDQVAKHLHIPLHNHHRAVDDAECTAYIYQRFLEMLTEQGKETVDDINRMSKKSVSAIKKLPTYHVIILAKNETGRVNLYRLISASHLDYYNRRPRIPKSVLNEHREGLIVGSACEAGELFQAVLNKRNAREIRRLVEFYDYLEIQPIGNNAFMLRDEKYAPETEEDLRELNRQIVELGDRYGKPVVATGDVHFMDPEDAVYRRIVMAAKGFEDADLQAPLYMRTTEEMLDEFDYLGPAKAKEVVVANPRRISDSIEYIEPVRPDKCPPVIEGSDTMLREICYEKAHSMYGPDLPKIVEDRLEKELTSIIGNGYAVMYIIAQKLVHKSNEDGYLVGSRGSVGSSFVATMAGITEVNPLSPHYYCTNCFYSDFDSEEVRAYAGGAGCDMPEKVCPNCGQPLKRDGFDIPFETFLGFYGDKEPDIDLNFSGEYQSRAHEYTEVIFGKGQTFRAGTIGTVALKTAYGYVMHYFENKEIPKRRCEIERLASGLEGIRRTTGQHPGGIIVLPKGEEIHSFTPVQHPANDMTTDIITTHFDYHSIDHNLLKLDILGHDDPTMIRRLQDMTGIDPSSLPLDSPEVMSLFQSPEALGVKPEQIGGCQTGSLGIPEFGTEFVIQMLVDTKPKNFSDLVRISGLSHGTDVWLNNAQTLIREGKATISTAICTRDDIMVYLILKGLEPGTAFKIMESVRKGKGVTDEWEEEMLRHDVPEWYIWSCRKIKYMFPKAHAAAYVMMAIRIAWFKVFQPLAYYACFFGIRATAFNYEMMCMGQERLEHYLKMYQERPDKLTAKEEDTVRDMKIVREMYARGFEFTPIDLYRAKANEFQIIDGKLMPSLEAIDGLGEKAAVQIVAEVQKGPFTSKENFRTRCKVSKTVVDQMSELGLLRGLPDSDQISLFDFQM